MEGGEIWEQKTDNDADLIVDGHAYLGDHDDGTDELRQKIRVGEDAELSYDVRIQTNEHRHPSDRLLVRLTDLTVSSSPCSSGTPTGTPADETRDGGPFGLCGPDGLPQLLRGDHPVLRTTFYVDKVSLEERP